MKSPLFIFVLFFSHLSFSQTVVSIKNGKVLLDAGSLELSPGDQVLTLDSNNKRRSILQIRQVKGTKATADIVKGQPASGHTLLKPKRKAQAKKESDESSDYPVRYRKQAYGFTGSLAMNTMKIPNFRKSPNTYSLEMTGTNFGVGGFYDYKLTQNISARAHGTLELFDIKSTSGDCANPNVPDCTVQFTQLGGYGTINYQFSPAPYRFWAGAGGGLFVYLSKKSPVLDTEQFFFNSMLMASFGLDYTLNKTTFIPVSFEYQVIPDKEAGVTALVLRAGWGKTF